MANRMCAVCGSDKKTVLFHQSFAGFSGTNLLTDYDVVACDDCGFCFADNIPEQDTFDAYYRELNKYENIGEDLKESKFDKGRFQIYVDYLKEFI